MNAPAQTSLRRGACPGLSAPMATGDGLLARLTPAGSTIALDAFAGLGAAARRHGNGIVEITSRGSIQIRGLSTASAPLLAAGVAALAIDANDGIPVLTDSLAGLGRHEYFDTHALAAGLRRALAPFAGRLSAKVSVALDGGGALHLDTVVADIRLRAVGSAYVHVALAGDAVNAVPLGAVALDRAAECVTLLFETLAASAPRSRMRDAIQGDGLLAFSAAVAGLAVSFPVPAIRPAADPVGVHRLASGANALGISLPFGHSDAETLSRLVAAAGQAGAIGVRPAPGRALLLIGVPAGMTRKLATAAAELGFIADPADPRRKVVACAGAPICASGEIAARTLAPALADAAGALRDGEIIHVSGCAKGCAHPAPVALAVFGRDGCCDVFAEGALITTVTPAALPEAITVLVRSRSPA